jgi:hypothetical protein
VENTDLRKSLEAKPSNSRALASYIRKQKTMRSPARMGFEVAVVLCLFAAVIGAFQEGETGMRCGAIAPMPQLPPQL